MPSHSHPPAAYTMEELTAATGVTARTVRYYIVEGLLPPPDGAGPATTYSDIHRNRLLLIGALKDAYLPLKEIRRRLARMREEEIAAAVISHEERAPSPPPRVASMAAPIDDAAAYIDRILGPQTRPPSPTAPGTPALSKRTGRGSTHPPAAAPVNSAAAPAQRWQRLAITPEAELMIEEETYQRRQAQIEAALDWLRRILNGS